MNLPAALSPEQYRVAISACDYEKARDFVKAARTHAKTDIEWEALVLMAIIAYARPFSSNEKGPSPSSDAYLTGVDPRAVLGADYDLHERIGTLRKKAVAHSESTYYRTERSGTVTSSVGMPGVSLTMLHWNVASEDIDLVAFERIAQRMHWACYGRLVEVCE